MPEPSIIYKQWDVVIVPFPFVDNPQTKPRPALVLSHPKFNRINAHSIMAMITTGGRTEWVGDILITDFQKAGLHQPCLIRPKIFTLDNTNIRRRIGELTPYDQQLAMRLILPIIDHRLEAGFSELIADAPPSFFDESKRP